MSLQQQRRSIASNTEIVVFSDIFGYTPELSEQLDEWCGADCWQLITPYRAQPVFDDDDSAYQHFIANGGIEAYTTRAQREAPAAARLWLGFSAGAAVMWRLLARPNPPCDQALGFYGGQIRDATGLHPGRPVLLIWPRYERHFDVNGVIQALADRPRLCQKRSRCGHGFMNPHSAHYSNHAERHYGRWLKKRIARR
ncbi:MAG: dienelactone hydrolase family protein [Wenzhouxiangellaceae bacterium]